MITRVRALRDRVKRQQGARAEIEAQIERDEKRAEEIEAEVKKLAQAVEVIQAATETRRQELRDRVENLVTRGLRAVFQREDFEFAFKVSLKRDVFGVIPVLRSKFGERDLETGIVDGHGGGVADVVSFLLRVIVLSLARPAVAPVLVLDESFRHVSPEYLRGCSTLLRELNSSAGIQFLLVTHKAEMLDAADVIYRAELVEGRTQFHLEHDLRDESFHRRPRRGEKASERGSAFDEEDMVGSPGETEVRISETEDVLARRQRNPGSRVPANVERQKEAQRKRKQREEMRTYRERRKKREPGWRG